MSGGSYNYLDSAADVHGIGGLLQRQDDLRNMAHRLDGLCPEAAAETRLFVEGGTAEQQVASVFHGIDAHLERLQPLWHAVEWCDSSDWGEDRLLEAVANYRALGPPDLPDVHVDCFRPVRQSELAYFVRLHPDDERYTMLTLLDRQEPRNLALFTERTDLRHLLVSLEEAVDRVRTAIELRTEAEKLNAFMWRVVPVDGVDRV